MFRLKFKASTVIPFLIITKYKKLYNLNFLGMIIDYKKLF